jgi:surface antigen
MSTTDPSPQARPESPPIAARRNTRPTPGIHGGPPAATVTSRRRPLANLVRLAALAFVAATITVTGPAPAHADGRPYVWTESADMFWCTSTQDLCANQTVTRVPRGTPLTIVCWRDDRQPFPNSSPRWFYVFLDNGQEGYLWAPQVADQTANTANCNTVNWINVSDWAIGRIGLTQWRSPQADGPLQPPYRTGVNAPAGYYWSGACLIFASDAWKMAGGDALLAAGSANEAWNRYVSQNRADTSGSRPPRGALVFWNNGGAGHVAISLGNWHTIGTWRAEPYVDPIQRYGVGSVTNYRGWVMPATTAPYNTH